MVHHGHPQKQAIAASMHAAGKSRSQDMTTMEALTVAGAYPGADPLDHGRKVVGPRNALQPTATRFDAKNPTSMAQIRAENPPEKKKPAPKKEAEKPDIMKELRAGRLWKDAKGDAAKDRMYRGRDRQKEKDTAPRSAFDVGPQTEGGMHLEFHPSSGFSLMWNGQVLSTWPNKVQAEAEMDRLLRKRPQQGTNQTMVGPDSSPFDQASTPAELAAPTQDQITEKFFDAFGVQPNFGVNGRR